jgi:integrase
VRTPKASTQGVPRMLSQNEVRGMPDASENKTHALILLLATTGLRISEALDAR